MSTALVVPTRANIPADEAASVSRFQPVLVEQYATERRETFTERPDRLQLRIRQLDGSGEYRLYESGRLDKARDVDQGYIGPLPDSFLVKAAEDESATAQEAGEGADESAVAVVTPAEVLPDLTWIKVDYRKGRADGVIAYSRLYDRESESFSYIVTYNNAKPFAADGPPPSFISGLGDPSIVGDVAVLRPDGVISVHISLEAGTFIDVTKDTAVSVITKKLNHVAIKLNPGRSEFNLSEIYQDMVSRTIRLAHDNDLETRAVLDLYRNFHVEDSLDERYEPCRILAMQLVQEVVLLERELYLSMQTVEDEQRELQTAAANVQGSPMQTPTQLFNCRSSTGTEKVNHLAAALFSQLDQRSQTV